MATKTVTLGTITKVEEVTGVDVPNLAPLYGKNGTQLGLGGMLDLITGSGAYDGYRVVTPAHTFLVLISNSESCCENWGYLSSDDDLKAFVGAQLLKVKLTNTALNTAPVDRVAEFGFDEGGIQFVSFVTDRGVLQLAVYNGHNGYYGHGILILKDDKVLLNTTI